MYALFALVLFIGLVAYFGDIRPRRKDAKDWESMMLKWRDEE